ncbi:EAL domain-containing protein [Candidatus Berkiella aquae]|uniref:Bifunctional diguanylate cyclase/phosphodiesterase n=1 Tax=Candidatus Berkiella aquae TaxID=295108 RepID=A0A0Q9YSE5_9GAMM|nr:EAL domain-containing protein [Candidatus Berkiella aquae]MCS5710835.1 bifunctional diguanylate cyclase/phosphodiesterase [Candidatus Berkiella aquae]
MPHKAKSRTRPEENPTKEGDFKLNEDALNIIEQAPEFERSSIVASKVRYSSFALRIVLIYLTIACTIAIALSDSVLSLFQISQEVLSWIAIAKIWVLIILSAGLLYYLIRNRTNILLEQQEYLKETLKKIQRLEKAHQLIIQSNHAIVRIRDKEQLLKEICQILSEHGQFNYAWIGIGESAEHQPDMIVTSDKNNHYLHLLLEGIHAASVNERGEPALSALRKKYPVIVNDVDGFSKKPFSWQTRALAFHFQSIAGFPFKMVSGTQGVMALYAKEKNFFNEEEVALLRILATDIGYGLSDIENKSQIHHAANYDVVTNLPNRQLYEDRMNQFISRAPYDKRYVGVIVIAIDNFSKTSESFGQAISDKLLTETGIHLSSLVRDGDTVARLAHNQIGIMLADVAAALDVARIAQKLVRPFSLQLTKEHEVKIHLHAGVAIYPYDGETAPALIENAIHALQEVESDSHIECGFYSQKMSSGIKYNQQLKESLMHSLERNELILYYQPIVDIRNRQIIGAEGLSRWRNANLGDVSPIQFITEAEESGFIIPLGEWVIKTACQQLIAWQQAEQDNFILTVNISAKQIMHPQFLARLNQLFEELNFDPKRYQLCFEIAESVLVNELKSAIQTLFELRRLGLKIIIDDFGTSYSSLSYLNQLPVNILKIDSTIVRNLGRDQNTHSLVRGILAFAKGMKLKTIAEGVETEQQMQMLVDVGCDYAQGYLFSAPVAVKNMESFFGKKL